MNSVREVSTCRLYAVYGFYDGGSGRELNLTIDRAFIPLILTQEEWLAVQARLDEQGVEMTLEFTENGDVSSLAVPYDFDLLPVAAELGLTRLIEGPWTLTIPISDRPPHPTRGE